MMKSNSIQLLRAVLFTVMLIAFNAKFSFGTIYPINIPLSGSQEVPPNASTATGNLTGIYDDVTNTLSFNLAFSGLSSPNTAAHFHAPASAGVVAPVAIPFGGFPLATTAGAYSNSYVLTAAQETDLLNGLWYVNIHTTIFPGGEIRGQLILITPNLSINNVTLNELNSGTSTFTFTVSLSSPAGPGGVTFNIATTDGSAQDDNPASEDNDYVQKSLTGQTIPQGDSTYTFSVTVNGDHAVEPDEIFFVNVANVAGATVVDGQGMGTITNDDTCPAAGWAAQTSGTGSPLYTVSAVSGQIAWAGGAGPTVRRTINGGITWTNATGTGITGDVFNIYAVDGNTAFCCAGFAPAFIFKTINGGTTWSQVYTLAAGVIDAIQMISPTEGYALGDPDGGKWIILKTTDGGNTWARMATEPIQAGSEYGWNNSFQVKGTDIWFGTNNSRVYHSPDLGVTWSFAATPGTLNTYALHFNGTGASGLGLAGGSALVKSINGGTSYSVTGAPGTTGNITGLEGNATDWWALRSNENIYKSTNQGATAWTIVHTQAGAVFEHIDIVKDGGCPVGWAVGDGGNIAKMGAFPSFINGPGDSITVCQNSLNNSLNSLLAVSDTAIGQTLTWSVISPPSQGTANGFPVNGTSTGGTATPTGLSYTHTGNPGPDQMTVQVSDGQSTDQIIIHFNINSAPTPVITGSLTFCAGSSTTLNESSAVTQPLTGATSFLTSLLASGSVSSCDCPPGYVAVGYQGLAGNIIDQMQLACKKLNPNGTLGAATVFTCSNGTSTGGSAVGPYFLPGNNIMVGIGAQEGGGWISTMTAQGHSYSYILANGQNSSSPSVATTLAGSVIGNTLGTLFVPDGMVVTGMTFNTTFYTSSISLRYTSLTNFQNQENYTWSTGATTQTINVNTAATFTVTVTNANGCTGTASATTTVNPVPDVTVPADTAICNGTLLPTGTFNFSTAANFGFGGKILIAYGDDVQPAQLKNNLLATPGVAQVDLFDALNGTPSLALMQQYDMVVTYSSNVYFNSNSLGDNLADYVDANGTVVIFGGSFFSNIYYHPGGRWQTGNYSPYNLSTVLDNTHNLGTFTAGHPLMAGVSALTSSVHCVVPVAGGATEVAQWDNGHSLIAFKGRVVGVTAFIGSNVTWSGDFAKVIVNAGNWINGTSAISWTNNNTAIGLAASGTGNSLPAFTATNATAAPVAATITVTASNSYGGATCSDTASFTITVNPTPAPIITGNLSFCAGSSTTLDAGVFASYSWSTGATTQTINVNTPGDYTVTVTDGNGCTGSASVTVTMNLPPPCIITGDDFCAGGSTQLCAATSSSYLWSTGATTECITVNTGGTYTVTVSNASGCTSSCSKTVTSYALPNCSITGNSAVCSGSSAQWCASIGNVSYTWSTGVTTHCITVNSASTFTVTVTDLNGCSSSCSKTVTTLTLPVCSITAGFCQGASTELCAATNSGYLWSTGATSQCITANTGTYTVTVTDANGCTNSCSKIVTTFTALPCSITGGNFCQGSSTQLCAATNSGYLWSTGATTQCISVNTGGTYTVTVTNSNGCTGSCTKTVTAFSPPVCSITGGDFCSGSGSQLCAASVPGPSVNTYLWSTGATTQCITVTASGTYTITVTDANGCTNSCSKTVTEYPKPPCAITGSDFCSGSSTQLCTSTAPAAPLFSYLWSTGATTLCITVTTGGTYTVTVTDVNGCTNSCSKTVTAYPLPTCSITGGNFCQGSSTQLCAATNSNYLWSTGATTQCITVNTGGTYTVTVTDGNGCTISCSKTAYAYQLPTCAITGNSSVCPGSTTQICGSVGSVSTYTYLWNTGATTQCITVGAGTYTVTATSTSGCTSSCSKTVTAYTPPVCTISGNIAYCDGSTTQLCGTPGMSSYLWSTGATTQCIAAAGGDYTVTVTNSNGCTSSCSITTHLRLVPVCSITGGNFCAGNSTQLCATIAPVGYVFSYAWSTGATTQCITLTTGGTYTVNITNQYGCSSSCSKTITVYPTPVCTISGNIAYCQGSTTQLCGTPGMASYLWSTGATTQCIAAAGGDYTVTVTNSSGCTSSCSLTPHLRLPPVCAITGNNFCQGSSSQLCATPAPAGYVHYYVWSTGATTQCITVSAGGTYSVTITNQYGCSSSCSKTVTRYLLPTCSITGTASVCTGNSTQWCAPAGLAAYLWSTGATTQCITVSTAATYTVTVTNTTGCTKSCSKTLTVKALPNCTVTGTSSVCPGSSTQWCAPAGLAAYLWSSGATTQCITVSTAATYTVTVTSTGGCTKSCSKTLTVKGVPACSITGTASICPGGATQWCAPAGLAAYLWSNGATTQCVSVSTAGIYTVTITNAGGCTSSCSKTLTIKTPPSCAINGGNICQGGSTQLCAATTAAGYLWSTGATTKCITISIAGTYTVTVTGTNACTNSCSKNVTVSSSPSCAITWNHTLCQGGSAQLCAGAGLSSYLWNTGATSQCITINATADYTVTVTNGSGCTSSCTVKSVAQPVPVCSITGNSVVSPGQTTPVCAPAGLTYLWNNGATTQCRNVAAGTYTVTVTNANGCTSSCSKTVTSAAKMVEPVVIGGDNGAIEASAYPNPFNEEATIEFRNTIASGHVVVELFNLTGSKMAVLFDKDVEQNVTYQTKVNSEDLAEGVYFYRIVSGDNIITGKLILLKE